MLCPLFVCVFVFITCWGLSPNNFNNNNANVRNVDATGATSNGDVNIAWVARGAITLKPGITIYGGNGTDINPYQIGPLVTRS